MRRRNGFMMMAALAAFVFGLVGMSDDAFAKAKKKKKKPPKTSAKVEKKAPKADPEALKQIMGGFKWGLTVDETYDVIFKQIDAKYQEQIDEVTDVYQQNQLRKKAAKEKGEIKKTFVKFEGKASGWDVSIIDREFDHKNDETMFVVWELDAATGKDQRRFYFFQDGKLWKMFIAFSADMFPENMTFAAFQAAMEKRYGESAIKMKVDADGVESFDFIYWRSGGYLLRAIDLSKFYGNYCLAISDDSVEKTIYARRAERNPKGDGKNPLVDAVADDPNKEENKVPDQNSDVVDQITKDGKKPKKK